MSDASQLIAQQIAAAGITPDELTPVGSASKAYVDAQDAILQTNITAATTAASNALSAHKSTGGNEHPAATTSTAGFMSSADKTKLDGVATGANNYVHPATHPPSIIAQDSSNRFVTDGEKAAWNAKANTSAVQAVQTNLDTHTSNTVIHVTQADRDRWDAGGGGSGGPSFGKVNDIQAATANDTVTFSAGPGIAVSTNTTTKTLTISTQGSSAPGPHASTHVTGGSDVIPDAVTGGASGLMSGSDATFVRSTGETKTGAQTKADTALASAKTYTDQQIAAIPDASTTVRGLATLNNTVTSTSTTQAATANAVKTANDNGTRAGSTTQAGQLQMYDGIDSTSTTLAATANAVRLAAQFSVTIGTTASVTYYVDGTAGNDTTGTGAQATPFKTIQKAADTLWNLCKGKLNHICRIYVKESITYNESVVISGFWGAETLEVRGYITSSASYASVNKIQVMSCVCGKVRVFNFNFTTTTDVPVYVNASVNVNIQSNLITGSSTFSGILYNASTGIVDSCTISNKGAAISAGNASTLLAASNTGTGNTVGLSAAQASTIGKSGTQASATTAESQSSGGVIRA